MNTEANATNRSDDFVAYHSTDIMGHELESGGPVKFLSRKSRHFLERAIGCNVWIITGTRDSSSHMIYRLVGRYTPSEIRDNPSDPDLHIIYGEHEELLEPPLVLNDLDWFQELFRAQNKFSYGFNQIRGEAILAALNSAIQP